MIVVNKKIGGELAEQITTRRSKLHVDHWKKRLFHEGYTREGRRVLSGDWSVRLFRAGRRETFSLYTPNAAVAANKAQQIYASLISVGWDATLAKFKPAPAPVEKESTIGSAIAAASQLAVTRPQSFAQAALRLRQIAGEIANIKPPKKRTAYKSPEFIEWRSKVDAVALSVLTGEAVRAWRDSRIAARSKNPLDRRAAAISADSTIRMARSIFSKRILSAGLGAKIALPSPMPFAGVTVGGSTKRFTERIDAAKLFADARTELETTQPEVFRAFSLCILGGLRRREADLLTWAQVDLDGKKISIERTEWFEPKSEESTRIIELDDAAMEIIRRAKADQPDPVFVLKGTMPKRQMKAASDYRCDYSPWKTWETLIQWLGSKGIQDGKPIHVLRKLAGSLVFVAHGLEQARGFLGHASISTTSNSYLATSPRVTVSIATPVDASTTVQADENSPGADEKR